MILSKNTHCEKFYYIIYIILRYKGIKKFIIIVEPVQSLVRYLWNKICK